MAIAPIGGAASTARPIASAEGNGAADAFAEKQMQTMQDIISGRNARQRAFIDSHPDTSQSFESVVSALFAAGSSHANEAARIAATVQDMRNAAKAYRDMMGPAPKNGS